MPFLDTPCVSPEIIQGQNTDDTYTLIIQDATGSYETANLMGKTGADGQSAYQAAIAAGFKGTEAEWLDSLKGAPGAIFTPNVSSDGTLTWTNDSGLANPESVNIRGPQGPPGTTEPIEIGDSKVSDIWNQYMT